jgi:hypothetical protein
LLFDQVRGLRAQDFAAAAQVGLDLVQRGFFFPSLVIGLGQFGGGHLVRIGDGGDHDDQVTVGVAVRDGVLDHPYQACQVGRNVLARAGLFDRPGPAGGAQSGA